MLTSTQYLRKSKQNFVKLAGNYLGAESPIFLSMETWMHHIDLFNQQYEKALAKDPLFGDDLMYRIHKRVQVFFTILQHDRHIGRRVGVHCGVWWSSEEGGERVVV